MVVIFILLFMALITDVIKQFSSQIPLMFLYMSFLLAIYFIYHDMTDTLKIAL